VQLLVAEPAAVQIGSVIIHGLQPSQKAFSICILIEVFRPAATSAEFVPVA
jgi:hypothetical protein